MHNTIKIFASFAVLCFSIGCKEDTSKKAEVVEATEKIGASKTIEIDTTVIKEMPEDVATPKGMVWIPGAVFSQGAVPQDKGAMEHEKPAHKVAVDGFFMDITEVTNDDFKKFVKETGYETVAEREIDWEEMKKQLPEGTPKPHDSIMQPGSLTFKQAKSAVPNLYDFSQWWSWTIGADWQHPNGPKSSIKGKGNYPVVHIAYEDALAYCEWANRRLPTEAEWERAARGTHLTTTYSWGDEDTKLSEKANTWEGEFPVTNVETDGFGLRAPVKSYPANDFGLYDMAGNVWEWTNDWYNTNYYKELNTRYPVAKNPLGADQAYNERDPYAKEKVMKGGSFLCNASYCASYRVSSRMATSLDSSLEHLGFRTVATADMVRNSK
ncbi:formylglycine-generating enzyme family protein [Zobellia nedashkovskayae]|uniref:formylglycine-generating enzyme family protein n=1 Tax=Zobellia nedashkovskayae TaxID=2779510 RepID=UPI001D0477FE|nr:formylglycine-generating enzyme family protein [Zobellia nedashkovskayae]